MAFLGETCRRRDHRHAILVDPGAVDRRDGGIDPALRGHSVFVKLVDEQSADENRGAVRHCRSGEFDQPVRGQQHHLHHHDRTARQRDFGPIRN